MLIPQRYDFSSKSQLLPPNHIPLGVVVNTTKVRFFKQITTPDVTSKSSVQLLLIPQRYDFSSKSQHLVRDLRINSVVVNTTKVRFFKQITTLLMLLTASHLLLLIPQRYDFSSKSQLMPRLIA